MTDYNALPEGLPIPEDDGAANHLAGMSVPNIALRSTGGNDVNLSEFEGRTVIYCYPLTGRPGAELPQGWETIPGARGCTTEACDFRDTLGDLHAEGVNNIFGLSSQSREYQAEVVDRLRLPFSMLSDERLQLADALHLPTFAAPGHERLYSRLTLVLQDSRITHVFYPIFPPNTHAQQVLEWLKNH